MTDPGTPAFDMMTQQLNQQDLPVASLYVVATPIGNMGDITFRAAHILKNVDGIACEDTRHTTPLLKYLGINKPLLALHEHNEREASNKLVEHLKAGQRWAYVSDAGTPGISDPGALLVQACIDHGLRVLPIPGASAVSAIASVAGNALSITEGHFQFIGFFPTKSKDQSSLMIQISHAKTGTIFYESPHRIADTLKTIEQSDLPRERQLVIGRELTKKFETIDHLTIGDISTWLSRQEAFRGEFAILIAGANQKDESNTESSFEIIKLISELSKHIGSKQIAEIVSSVSNISKKDAYQLALDTKKPTND